MCVTQQAQPAAAAARAAADGLCVCHVALCFPSLLRQVYNFDSREKVRADEEAAAAAEAATRERALASERAYRHGVLLERATGSKRRRADDDVEDAAAVAPDAQLARREGGGGAAAHVNLFEDIEARRARACSGVCAQLPRRAQRHVGLRC
jgi:hypothetical protein